MADVVAFDKYRSSGAYHWLECDRRYRNWKRYNPAVDARYKLTVEAICNIARHARVLDVGCGDGLLMARLAPFMNKIVGVETDETAVALARDKLKTFTNCEVIHASSYDLPAADNSFDVVVSADVIEHLKEPAEHLRQICRVVRRDGALVLTTPKYRPDRRWDVRHEKEYRADELESLLLGYFEDIELRYFWPMTWSRLYATKLGWRLLKLVAIGHVNPFTRSGTDPRRFGQILAVCRKPRPITKHG